MAFSMDAKVRQNFTITNVLNGLYFLALSGYNYLATLTAACPCPSLGLSTAVTKSTSELPLP